MLFPGTSTALEEIRCARINQKTQDLAIRPDHHGVPINRHGDTDRVILSRMIGDKQCLLFPSDPISHKDVGRARVIPIVRVIPWCAHNNRVPTNRN